MFSKFSFQHDIHPPPHLSTTVIARCASSSDKGGGLEVAVQSEQPMTEPFVFCFWAVLLGGRRVARVPRCNFRRCCITSRSGRCRPRYSAWAWRCASERKSASGSKSRSIKESPWGPAPMIRSSLTSLCVQEGLVWVTTLPPRLASGASAGLVQQMLPQTGAESSLQFGRRPYGCGCSLPMFCMVDRPR